MNMGLVILLYTKIMTSENIVLLIVLILYGGDDDYLGKKLVLVFIICIFFCIRAFLQLLALCKMQNIWMICFQSRV